MDSASRSRPGRPRNRWSASRQGSELIDEVLPELRFTTEGLDIIGPVFNSPSDITPDGERLAMVFPADPSDGVARPQIILEPVLDDDDLGWG